MDARVRLVFSGIATVAASIAVVCAVAVTNSVALADSVGVPVARSRIDVPVAVPSPTPSPSPSVTAAVAAPATETVPAPAPEDLAPDTTSDSEPVSEDAAVPTPDHPDAATQAPHSLIVGDADERSLTARAATAGGWAQLVEWAHSRGWSDADIARWAERHQDVIAEYESRWRATQTPAHVAGSPSVGASRDGSKKDQSPTSPDRRG